MRGSGAHPTVARHPVQFPCRWHASQPFVSSSNSHIPVSVSQFLPVCVRRHLHEPSFLASPPPLMALMLRIQGRWRLLLLIQGRWCLLLLNLINDVVGHNRGVSGIVQADTLDYHQIILGEGGSDDVSNGGDVSE